MRGLVLGLVAGALLLAGCASSDAVGNAATSTAPTTTTVAAVAGAVPPPSTSTPSVPPPANPALPPPTTASLAPPVTTDVCTEARTVVGDVELTFEEAATHLDDLAARSPDSGFADTLRSLAAAFRSGSAPSPDPLDAHCP